MTRTGGRGAMLVAVALVLAEHQQPVQRRVMLVAEA